MIRSYAKLFFATMKMKFKGFLPLWVKILSKIIEDLQGD
jgi:hypothetical protein